MTLETDNKGNFLIDGAALDAAISRCNILIGLCQENNIALDEALLAVSVFIGRGLADHDEWDAKRIMAGINNLVWRNYMFHTGARST